MKSARPQPLGKIKGAVFAEFLIWYQAKFGQAALQDVLQAADRVDPGLFDASRSGLGVLSSQWYRAELVHAALDAVVRRHSAEALRVVADEAAEVIMSKTLRGIYRTVFALCVSPERYARNAPKLWSLHYDSGTPQVAVISSREHAMTFMDWHSHHPLICQLNMAAAKPIYSAMGCKGVAYRRASCVSETGTACRVTIAWQ